MSTSSPNYKDLGIPHLKELFKAIDALCNEKNIPYYLIGANAISLEMLKKGIKPIRATRDIDFAIMVSTMDEYEGFSAAIQEKGFEKLDAAWRFHHKKFDILIDLLPFGEIEESGTIGFNDRTTDLHVLGLKEVLEDTSEINIGEIKVRIPLLPGIIVLKLVAWSDRPEVRHNDLYDILRIIELYNDLEFEKNMEQHFDAIPENEEFDNIKFSSRILGRKVRVYLDKSAKLNERIRSVLDENTASPERSNIARNWAREKDWDLEYCVMLLKEFKSGIEDRDK